MMLRAAIVFAAACGAVAFTRDEGEKFLAEKAKQPEYAKLPSGMLVKVLKRGEGEGLKSPKVSDPCEVHYKGTLIDGSKFDSSYDRGQPATFAPNQVIKGWTEALQLMCEGDKWELLIPFQLAYGERGRPPKIPGYAPLAFDVELMKVKRGGKACNRAALDDAKVAAEEL